MTSDGDAPLNGPPFGEADQLSKRDAEIHRVLGLEDPALAGLFWFLLRAIAEVERAGGVHMLGHAGRELSLGVLHYLANEGRALTDDEQETANEKEQFRLTIARALRLQPGHPSVTGWFKAHNRLVKCAHYTRGKSANEASRTKALAAANALTAYLWSRTGPFFGAKEDVERLLAVEIPKSSDIDALHTALTRPAVRWDFFRRLEQPGWVLPLLRAGFFKNPPDVLPPESDGKQKWEGWAEGEYLRRMADKAPKDVRDALKTIPKYLRNPYVWNSVALAAKALPAAIAVGLVPMFRGALQNTIPWMLQKSVGEIAVKLANAGHAEAFPLARDVLRVIEGKASVTGIVNGDGKKDSALYGLDAHEAEDLVPKLVQALAALDAEKALKFFMHRLDEALRIEWGDPAREPLWASPYWCPDLSQAAGHHGFKEHVATGIARLAVAASSAGSLETRRILKLLREQGWRIYKRVRLYVLAHSGHRVPVSVNSEIGKVQQVFDEYPSAEYLLLLVRQFENASPRARQTLADAIVGGPDSDKIRLLLTEGDEPPSDEDVRKCKVRWQRKRLRRFGGRVPRELGELVAQIEADQSVPSPSAREIQLEDHGSSGGYGWSGGPTSPLTPEELNAQSPEELFAYVASFHPNRENFYSPTPAGLAVDIARRVREDPAFGAVFASFLPAPNVDRTYVRAVLQGFVGAAEENQAIDWPVVFALVERVSLRTGGRVANAPSDFSYADTNWKWTQQVAAKAVSLSASKNLLGEADAEMAWRAVEALLSSPATWDDGEDVPETMDAALSAALNTTAGECVVAFLEVVLWNYRKSEEKQAAGLNSRVSLPMERLREGVRTVAAAQGSAGHAGRVRLGQYLPQLLLVDREWVLETAPTLFAGGFALPLTNPVWGGYITTQRFYNSVFNDLRIWYSEAAHSLPLPGAWILEEKQKDPTWSPTRHLSVHCLVAVLRGLTAPNEANGFVDTVFERSPVTDRSHAYWEIYRSWKGPAGSVPAVMVERMLAFWSWRLDVLATREAGERKAEAGALGWLVSVTVLPDDRVLSLLSRTTVQADGEFPMEHSMWTRLLALAEIDMLETLGMVEYIIRAVLRESYPHFTLSDVGPVLTVGLNSASAAAQQKAKDLINLLGDKGFTEFGALL